MSNYYKRYLSTLAEKKMEMGTNEKREMQFPFFALVTQRTELYDRPCAFIYQMKYVLAPDRITIYCLNY